MRRLRVARIWVLHCILPQKSACERDAHFCSHSPRLRCARPLSPAQYLLTLRTSPLVPQHKQDLSAQWRHRLALVATWNDVCLNTTLRVLNLLYGPTVGTVCPEAHASLGLLAFVALFGPRSLVLWSRTLVCAEAHIKCFCAREGAH